MPLLPDALARFECQLMATHTGGDHRIPIGRLTGIDRQAGDPLLSLASRDRRPEAADFPTR